MSAAIFNRPDVSRRLSIATALLLAAGCALWPAHGANLYPNSSFELGLSPVLSGGETQLVEGAAFQGKRYASSRLEYIYLKAVSIPEGASQITVSAYLRSAKGSGRLAIGVQNSSDSSYLWATGKFLGAQWTRHSATFPVTPTLPGAPPALISPRLWNRDLEEMQMDAVQVEFAGLSEYNPPPVVDTRVWTDRYGNVFDADSAVAVKCGVANPTAGPVMTRWVISVADHRDVQVYQDSSAISLAPEAMLEKTINLGSLAFGHYTVLSSVSVGTERLAQQRTTIARVAGRRDDPGADAFGMHIKYVNESSAPEITDSRWGILNMLGAGWARLWCSWREVEATRGIYDWKYYDAEIGTARRRGKRILGVFYNRNPLWAGPDDIGTLNLADNTVEREAFIRAFVARYQDSVDAWEIFNEPYWFFSTERNLGRGEKFIADYAVLHRATYTIIKTLDPTAPAIANVGDPQFKTDRDWGFFLGIAQAGLMAYTDAISMHEYHYAVVPTDLRSQYQSWFARVAQVLAAHGRARLPVWQTETATITDDGLDPLGIWYDRYEHFMKEYLPDEWEGAKVFGKAVILRRVSGVKKEFFFNLSQPGPTEQLLASFRNRWEEPKVIYPVQVAVSRILGGADFCGEGKCDLKGGQLFFFKDATRVLAAYWTDGTKTTLTVRTPKGTLLALVDLMGNSVNLAADSEVILPLDSEPRFVVASVAPHRTASPLAIEHDSEPRREMAAAGNLDRTLGELRAMLCQAALRP